jgi:putative flippase GtrA
MSGPSTRFPFPREVPQVARFALVGGMATLLYTSVGIGAVSLGIPLMEANAVAFAASLAFSYLGHHHFSFGVKGCHHVYGPRFVLVSSALVAATFALTSALQAAGGLDHRVILAIVAVAYAAASYLINACWSFRREPGNRDARLEARSSDIPQRLESLVAVKSVAAEVGGVRAHIHEARRSRRS